MLSRRRLPLVACAALLLAGGAASVPLAVSATTPSTPTSPTTPTTPVPFTTPVNPTPPKVTTGSATSIGRTTATLGGSINPNGAATTYRFEYGTTTTYGLTTPDASVAAGVSAVDVTRAVTGLTVATTYHYRLVATNAAGVTRGADKSLKTVANPARPSVSTQPATALTGEGGTLTARVNPQGQDTTYFFEYGPSTKYGAKTAVAHAGAGAATVTVTAPITGLKANTKYSFRIVAVNGAGTAKGGNRTFTTTRGLSGVTASTATPTITWNGSATISGTVGGLSAGGVKVTLLRQDAPFTAAFRAVATQTASSAGAFSFAVGPLWYAARFQITTQTTPAVGSASVQLDLRLFAKLRVAKMHAKTVQLRGQIYPSIPQGRATIQRRTPKGKWVRVSSAALKHNPAKNRSTYSATVARLTDRKARYRVVIRPRDAGAHVVTTTKGVAVARQR